MNTIKFSKCPIGRHKGEEWDKMVTVKHGQTVKLIAADYRVSTDLTPEQMKMDTFHDMTPAEFLDIIELFYRRRKIDGIFLVFTTDWGSFTTYRKYTPAKGKYYKGAVGEIFRVHKNYAVSEWKKA